jgi:hypothetical protein
VVVIQYCLLLLLCNDCAGGAVFHCYCVFGVSTILCCWCVILVVMLLAVYCVTCV